MRETIAFLSLYLHSAFSVSTKEREKRRKGKENGKVGVVDSFSFFSLLL